MKRIMCVFMGVVFLGLGFLGMTGIVPMFKNDEPYITIGQMLIGFIGLVVGIYSGHAKENARQRKVTKHLRKENENMKKENLDQLENDHDALIKEHSSR